MIVQVVSYQYDPNSNRTQLKLNGILNVSYQYDLINRLTHLTDSASLDTAFDYDATNKLTSRTLPNGVLSTWEYDGLDRLKRLKHVKGANTLLDLQYQFSDVNNITQMIDDAGTHNYSYDPLDRLTAATHPNQPNESYTYDDVGNRTASHQGSSYSYQTFNRLVTANSSSFGYDANGNLTSRNDASGSWTYTWDYENRLKQSSFSGGVTVNYSYDAIGRRIVRSSSATGTTKLVYDGTDVIRDLDGSGNLIADYLNGPGVDNKLRQTVSGVVSYFLLDRLKTTSALADLSGNVTSSVTYDSFGRITSGSLSSRYGYTGRELDLDTGLMYYRARWHDPGSGRFASEDPIGLFGDINSYSYVGQNPLSFSDPSGLCGEDDTPHTVRQRAARCAAIVRRMLKQIGEMERLWNRYDPVADYYGGHPIRKQMPDGSWKDLGKTKPRGHYEQLVRNQEALRDNFEDFKRECLKKNDNTDPGLPADVEKWVNLDIPVPTNNHTLWEDIRDWWRNLPPVPKNWPNWLPPPVPIPVPAWP